LIATRDDLAVQSGQTGGVEAVRLGTGALRKLVEENDVFFARVIHLFFFQQNIRQSNNDSCINLCLFLHQTLSQEINNNKTIVK